MLTLGACGGTLTKHEVMFEQTLGNPTLNTDILTLFTELTWELASILNFKTTLLGSKKVCFLLQVRKPKCEMRFFKFYFCPFTEVKFHDFCQHFKYSCYCNADFLVNLNH